MKRIFSKILGGEETQAPEENSERTHPAPSTIDSLSNHQRLSVIGWVANKLGQLVNVDGSNRGKLIREVLDKDLSNLDKNNLEDLLYYLADKLVSWMENEEDVYFRIREMKLTAEYHKHLLAVYEVIKKEELFYYNGKSQSNNEVSEDDKVWEVYRDVLHAASQRKFLLIKEEEITPYKNCKVLYIESIVDRSDIPKARNAAKEVLEELGLPRSTVSSYVLLISEAITNIIKHAKDGKLILTKSEKSIHILIEDTGSGFPLKILPYTVLMAGYSTKKSLGQGFTLMLKIATRVLLKTSSKGSTLILILEENEDKENE